MVTGASTITAADRIPKLVDSMVVDRLGPDLYETVLRDLLVETVTIAARLVHGDCLADIALDVARAEAP